MHHYNNSLEAMPTTTGRLTRPAKRNLRRIRSMLREFRSINASNSASGKIAASIEFFSHTSQGQRFLANQTNIQLIYYKCLEIWHTCFDFRCSKIIAVVFVSNMIKLVQNLSILITDSLISIKAIVEPFLKSYFYRDLPTSLMEHIGHMVKNTTSAVMKLDEGLEDEDENQQPTVDESKLKYKIIFKLAKNRIPRTTQSSEIISAFSEQLSLLIEEITTELTNNYEEWKSKNIERLGKDEANELFSRLGMKTLNDFANLNFEMIIQNKNIVETTQITANEELLRKMWTFYEKVLYKVSPRSTLAELGALETCQLLQTSLAEVFNPLGDKFKQTKTYPSDNSTFFDQIANTLYIDRMAQELSAAIVCNKRTNKISSQLTDENVESTILFLCDKFYRKVEPKMPMTNIGDRQKIVKECYHHFMKLFTTFVQQKNKSQNPETSNCSTFGSFSDQRTFVSNYKNICVASKFETFASAVEYFTRDNNLESLAEEYSGKVIIRDNFDVEVCKEINEDWIRIFSINEGGYCNLRAYKSNAARLFDLDANQMELVKWENRAVILKCGREKYIIFQTVDTKSIIAMGIDTSKEPSS